MLKDDAAVRFSQDPLSFLDQQFPAAGNVVRTGQNEYCLADPLDARAVLRNDDGRYLEHSDFFHTRHGLFGPRSAQLKMRRESRALLREFLATRKSGALSAFVEANLPLVSEWPDAGNRLVYRYLLPVLLAPDSSPKLRLLLDEIVERAVLAKAKSRQSRLRRMILQFRTTLRLSKEIEARQHLARAHPIDLLDVVACSAEHGQGVDELAEVFLSFVFAIAGSVGFVLAWSIYLSGTHQERVAPPEWVVQEALRLWPVAWQLGRHPARDHQVSGVDVGTTDEVVVCPYLVQRNPRYWSEPADFQPDRWSDPESWRNPAFIPFGYGPHRCVAADLSSRLISEVLEIITHAHTLSIETRDARPTVAAAMAPPAFRLTLGPRNLRTENHRLSGGCAAAAETEHQSQAGQSSF
ncbi:MAG: cytochrome P450 [Dokdonella sp.]